MCVIRRTVRAPKRFGCLEEYAKGHLFIGSAERLAYFEREDIELELLHLLCILLPCSNCQDLDRIAGSQRLLAEGEAHRPSGHIIYNGLAPLVMCSKYL